VFFHSSKRFPEKNLGFTLIELIVVLALISIMLFVTVPKFMETVFQDDLGKTSRWLIGTVRHLKTQSVKMQKRHYLHFDPGNMRFWLSHEAMSENDVEKAKESGFEIPEDLHVSTLLMDKSETKMNPIITISFYEKGYSDPAVFNVDDGSGKRTTLRIEPFLPWVAISEDS
jgi:prepilin-type N-terminal cleavage/methylation domain-containing protein